MLFVDPHRSGSPLQTGTAGARPAPPCSFDVHDHAARRCRDLFDMLPENASALVGAAILTVLVFPPLANVLRSEWEATQPVGRLAIAAHRLAVWPPHNFPGLLASFRTEPC